MEKKKTAIQVSGLGEGVQAGKSKDGEGKDVRAAAWRGAGGRVRGREGGSGRLMAICSPFHFNVGERPRAKPPPGSAGPYKAGVTLPRGLTGAERE